MEDLRITIGKNLASLRKAKKLTQIELAEKMNYSDKAVSKWEQGATMPDIETLVELCNFYGVTLDYLVDDKNIENPTLDPSKEKTIFVNRIIITCLLVSIVWMAATIIFVYPIIFAGAKTSYWQIFVWAVPATCLVTLFANFIYFKRHKVTTFVSMTIFVWSLLTSLFLHFSTNSSIGYNLWMLYLIGIPTQAILILWFMMRKK